MDIPVAFQSYHNWGERCLIGIYLGGSTHLFLRRCVWMSRDISIQPSPPIPTKLNISPPSSQDVSPLWQWRQNPERFSTTGKNWFLQHPTGNFWGYTAKWGIIWYLPPIKGTRKLHWIGETFEDVLFLIRKEPLRKNRGVFSLRPGDRRRCRK